MEIPQDLSRLYRHWPKQVRRAAGIPDVAARKGGPDIVLLEQMGKFAGERMRVWEKRQNHQVSPWTADPIIASYRFCNIYRELDRQTIEYHRMLNGLRDDFDLWLLNMFFCRMICRPETVKKTGLISYDEKNNREVYERLMKVEKPRFGNAYVFPVSTILRGKYPTREKFLCFYLTMVMRKVARVIEKFNDVSVCDALEKVLPVFGVRLHFLWTEVLIDTAYQYPELLDLFGRFPIGPGSGPTMRRLDSQSDPEDVCLQLLDVKLPGFPYLTFQGESVGLSAENWEGIGCEFRKYTNLAAGAGRRRKYRVTES